MIPLDEARQFVLSLIERSNPVVVPVSEALGMVLASDVVSEVAIPPFDNTAMDGFALRYSDVADAPCDLEIVGTVAAGDNPTTTIGQGQAMRIMTGAVIPPGADAVVMVELTSVDGNVVHVTESVPEGNHVRPAGDDLKPGELVFSAGEQLSAGHLGVLCSLGLESVPVYPRPRIGVVSTGDELVADGSPLQPGQIRDSNRRTILSLVQRCGAIGVDLGLVHDDEQAIEAVMRRGVAECDAVMTTGGVSMGDFDYVKAVLSRIGDMRWMQVAIKPAKPLAFGTVGGVPVFGFPGNPVSCMVSFELFGRPGLRKMMGVDEAEVIPTPVVAVAAEALDRRPDGKTHFLRVHVSYGADGRLQGRSAGGQGSHMLWAMAKANALAVVPDGDGVPAGGQVQVLLLD
ncbi:MAG: molybdopterin molybdotransferase MoeA [Acidimicrobiales bacterium]|nr:molybdopterin molybdotransferase MoeA [Acidimicrobiales bacterium]